MADDAITDEDDALDEEELEDDALDEEELEEAEDLGGENIDGEFSDDDDDEEDDDDDVATPARPSGEDDDEDEDEDDVEADLDAILKDRIAAGDDEDEDEEDEAAPPKKATPAGDAEQVQAKQENEFSCPHCFLLVNRAAVVNDECPHCGGAV